MRIEENFRKKNLIKEVLCQGNRIGIYTTFKGKTCTQY